MRLLLLSLIYQFAQSEDTSNVECGTAADANKFTFIASGACTTDTTTAANCKNTDPGTGDSDTDETIEWWKFDKTATKVGDSTKADGNVLACTYSADPWAGANAFDTDGLWDVDGVSNYEVKVDYVAKAAARTDDANDSPAFFGRRMPTTAQMEKGFAAIAQGEAYSPELRTTLKAAIKGGDGTVGGDVLTFCTHATRAKFRTLTTAQNVGVGEIDYTKTGRCIDGEMTEITDFLDHNTAGDGTKKCYHLPWEANYKAASACTASTHVCDRFVESASLCIEKTKQMPAYTAATDTVKHCTIQPGAGSDDKYRHADKDYASQACTAGDYCNAYGQKSNSDPICIPSANVLGTSAKSAARAAGALVTGSTTDTKWCIGVTLGAKRCATTEVCNPHADSRAELCIDNSTVAANNPKSMAFGAVGAAAPAGGAADTRAYCIGDNAVGKICDAATVCNYAGGTQSDSTVGGEVCLPHTKLLGTIADTAAWTAVAQKKLDGVVDKYCLATDGTAYSSKVCATTEKCNPHASSPADVCKTAATVLNHGDIAPEAAEVVADSVVVCIGKSFWKNCASTNGDVKEVCNEGAAALTDVCILTTDCMDPDEPLKAFRLAGVETAEDQKWCFATDGADKCGLDTLCNPSGVDGGTGSAAICADATKRVPHGEAATEELIHCYGDTGNAVLATDESEDGWLCDEGKGKFHDPKTKMEPRSKNETPDPVPEGEKAVEVCFGKDKVETCDVGVYCNSMGTETGCSDAACTSNNICITEESIIAEGEQWVEEGKSVCLNADATAGEDCTTDKMYCDQTEGVCSAEEIASTEEPSSGGEGEAASGCATQSLAAAAVVAILSA